MKRVVQLALGVLTAIGGFMEIGEIVAMSLVGARFGLLLAWVVPVGVLGIIVFAEMAGRVAAVSQRPVFDVVRERLGPNLALANLAGSFLITLATLGAEIGGVALALELASSLSYVLWIPLVGFLAWLIIWRIDFRLMENTFALMGLLMIIMAVALWRLHPDWSGLWHQGVDPAVPSDEGLSRYWYYAVGIFGAAFMPYEVFFFSSGAVEEGWTRKDLLAERSNAIVGFIIGGMLALAFMAASAVVLEPRGIEVSHLSQVAIPTIEALGKLGLAVLIVGIVGATFGAALETSLSCGYMIAQYLGWQWGKFVRPAQEARFHVTIVLTIVAGTLLVLLAGDPVQLTEFVIVLSAIALPLTYFPVLIVANDRSYMGARGNTAFANTLGSIYLFLIILASLAAIPLMVITKVGS